MASKDIYGEVNSASDLKKIFAEIRDDVEKASSRGRLTELYRRAGYLITLTYAPSWKKHFGGKADSLRQSAEEEFSKTARKINKTAKANGIEADYDEEWGSMKKHKKAS